MPRSFAEIKQALSRFGASTAATAGVEMALVAPAAMAFLALAIYGGQGLSIQRKVTLATRAVGDLVSQTQATSSGVANISSTTLTYDMSLASLIVYPYDSTKLTVVVSEVKVTGTTTGSIVWSQSYNGGTARTANSNITLSSALTAAGATYLILSELQYNYQPVVLVAGASGVQITDSIYMVPRAASQVSLNGSSSGSSSGGSSGSGGGSNGGSEGGGDGGGDGGSDGGGDGNSN